MRIGVLAETYPGERRVALVPDQLAALRKAGHEVCVQAGAGVFAGFSDAEYQVAGARMEPDRAALFAAADVILQVRGLGLNRDAGQADLHLFHAGQAVIAFHDPLGAPQAIETLAAAQVTAISMELIPRITRAQSMDALSSMGTIAGYKAVLLAAAALPKLFPLMMTAAGTLAPAKLFVVGAGVAGLQALATAKRLGAVTSAYDIRPSVKDQIASVGARFIEFNLPNAAANSPADGKGGYAAEQTAEFLRRQQQEMAKMVATQDVVITTASVPGRKAPILITGEMVRGMAPGSVIVDLAADRGGNCELTQPGRSVEVNGVTVIGPDNIAATVPNHASRMYSRNIAELFQYLYKAGQIDVHADDEIVRETILTQGGAVLNARVRALLEAPTSPVAAGLAPAARAGS